MSAAELLTRWVVLKHQGQLIKRTSQPYFNHLLAVAEMAKPAALMGYEVGLCHDLLEDTATAESELPGALISFGYTTMEAMHITDCVVQLTDVFTATAYPALSKQVRKQNEAARLVTISADAQTVKYCDVIDNIGWVLKHDLKNAPQYLARKQLLLTNMTNGDAELREKALNMCSRLLAMIEGATKL